MAGFLDDLRKKAQARASQVYDQVNMFDNNRTYQQTAPTQNKSNFQQVGQIGGQTSRAVAGGTARVLNTAAAQIPQVYYTGAMVAANVSHNPTAFRNANYGAQVSNNLFQRGKSGLLNAGTLYNSQESQSGDLKTGLKRIGGGIAEAGLEIGSLGVGGTASKQIVKQGVVQGIKSQLPRIAANAALNTAQGGIAAYNQNASLKDIKKAALLSGVVGTVSDIGMGVGGAGLSKLSKKVIQAAPIKKVSADFDPNNITPAKFDAQGNLILSTTPKVSLPENAPSSGMRQRGLATTILEDPNTAPQMKSKIGEMYKVRNTKDLQSRASNLVKDDPEMAMRVFRSDSNTDVGTMIGSELSAHLSRTGQHEAAIEVAQTLSREATHRGQANQALAAWGKLAPESILRFTQHVVDDYNKSAELIGTRKELVLKPQQAQKIAAMSEKLQGMVEGNGKDIATKQLLNTVKEVVPSSWVSKLSTAQTIAQLLNPKTMTRNVLGNTMFSGLENASQVLAAGIDKGISTVRGTPREVGLPNLKTQFEGLKRGAKQQLQESKNGVNLGPNTQFEISDVPAFRTGVMKRIEKTMGITLQVPDRAAFTAAYDDTVQGLMKANKLDKPTEGILAQAEATGLYRTFQDNSKAAELFVGLKGALNTVAATGKDGKKWGLGDLILKYPKTPGNILSRGIDYSPAGLVKGVAEVGIHAAQGKPFDQGAFANSIARGTVGTTTLVGTGAALGALGIITEKPSQDTDTRNLQKASGKGGYQINVTALRRFIGSGFDKKAAQLRPNDTLVSYDWAQPASIPLSAGASLASGKGAQDGAISSIAGAADGLNTLVEQPLISGVSTFVGNIKNYGVPGAFVRTGVGAPASFVPTALNQVRQLTDNNTRNVYDPSLAQQSLNQVKNKIPGLDRSLPNKVGALGENLQNYQNGGNNLFNVAVNPAFVNKYQPNESANLPLDIYNRSGIMTQIPTTTKTTQSVNGKSVKLTANQNQDFQRFVGQTTKQVIDARTKDPQFMALSDGEKAKEISSRISDIQAAARYKLLGDSASKQQANAVDKILTGNLGYAPKPLPKTKTTSNPKATTTKKALTGGTSRVRGTSTRRASSTRRGAAPKMNLGSAIKQTATLSSKIASYKAPKSSFKSKMSSRGIQSYKKVASTKVVGKKRLRSNA